MPDLYARMLAATRRFDPEKVHRAALRSGRVAGAVPPVGWTAAKIWGAQEDRVELLGMHLRNRVGLAAGFDKDALAFRGLARIGFGHIEIGTVTPRPQAGNPRPRLFRLDEDQAIINRLGFPSRGAHFVAARLSRRPRDVVIGVNIGKQSSTSNEDAPRDYLHLLDTFAPLADYLAVNVSSPNTPGLRDLQSGGPLGELLRMLVVRRRSIGSGVPLLVKISPDLDDAGLDDVLKAIIDSGADGIIAGNTTVGRPELHAHVGDEEGGLSGLPLLATTVHNVREIRARIGSEMPVIAAGGVADAAAATELRDAGASLIQMYTGLVFRGPRLVKEVAAAAAGRT